MPLSRLENFLKNTKGNILYVSPSDIDSTDSYENRGNSLTRPFKTIQRALLEAARFSYQVGTNNDLFSKTTILLYPGDHIVDNRPGWIPYDNGGQARYYNRSGESDLTLSPLTSTSNLNLEDPNNDLYKLNSIYGGVILPRGTSLVGLDLRKTKIRPKYVPDPENNNIERSALFRVTGTSYLWQFTILDADPNGNCYKNYLADTFVPNFSHHKLTAFEYADGLNDVVVDDTFLNFTATRTDLEMYYEKVGDFFDAPSGRPVEPDYPSGGFDFEPKIDEYRIVGPIGGSVGVSSIRSGNGTVVGATPTITVTLDSPLSGLDVDTAFQINNVNTDYDGQHVVSGITSYISGGTKEFTYQVQSVPTNPLPTVVNATVELASDTVTSASPYIFNISLRSVWGMCGLHADGSKATGFKSMVVAQFTGIGLQKDDRAFTIYEDGIYLDSLDGETNLHKNSRAIFKPNYRNYHIKASNNAFIQIVSVFAIGFADHFLSESGGDLSITNSNSNFGARSLRSVGFRDESFNQDDVGYITHIIPSQEITTSEVTTEFASIDIAKTINVGVSSHLYLYNETNPSSAPSSVIDGYRVGARSNEKLFSIISDGTSTNEYFSRVVMPSGEKGDLTQVSSEKSVFVSKSSSGINSITTTNSTLTFDLPHNFINGESVRILSETGFLPDGLVENRIYYAIVNQTVGAGNSSIQLSETLNEALNGNAINVNNNGGILKVVSRVSDKKPGDIGHPVQYDFANGSWYVNVSSASTENGLYSKIVGLGTTTLGASSPRTFIKRKPDTRNTSDKLYRLRYVVPKEVALVRPPVDGFIIQESSTTIESGQLAITDDNLSNASVRKNIKIISGISYSLGIATVYTEVPHNLSVGSQVKIRNVKSTNNITGIALSAYNKNFTVSGISSSKAFNISIGSDPGVFANSVDVRTTSELPYFERSLFKDTYYVYRSEEVKKHIPNQQDGVYHLICVNASNSPIAPDFSTEKFTQNIQDLYPQIDRDNPLSDPPAAHSFAKSDLLGKVVTNDLRNSITKESVNKFLVDVNVGLGITNIVSTSGTTHILYTKNDHGLNGIKSVGITSAGQGYGRGSGNTEYLYNATLVGFAGSIVGKNATAILTVNSSGSITAVKITDPGSAYGIGNTLRVVGVATTTATSFFPAYLTVNGIIDNTNDVIQISGVSSESYSQYNNLYRITGISTGENNTINVSSGLSIVGFATVGLGETIVSGSYITNVGPSLRVSSLTYDNVLGIATVQTIGLGNTVHGLQVGNKVRIVGSGQTIYNGDFVVKEVLGISNVVLNVGVSTQAPTATGDIFLFREGFSSQSGNTNTNDENVGGRMVPFFAGITTVLNSDIASRSTTSISIQNFSTSGLKLGDYIQVNSEIMRISDELPLTVFRGVLGSVAGIHSTSSAVKKVRVLPIEFRRSSIIRASGHTFEYVGFGPGNYSTAFPEKQDRILSGKERLLSQALKQDGGLVVYTGMNDEGDFYVGNKKVSSATGQEEVFDAPILTVTGEEVGTDAGVNVAFDVLTPLEINISRSIRVEGGPNKDIVSQFNGPVILNEKLTSNSLKGIEAYSLYLQGDAEVSRKFTVGISTPTSSGNLGDFNYYTSPQQGDYTGWVYTRENVWRRFGPISLSLNSNDYKFNKLGIGIGTLTTLNNPFQFGTENPSGGISTSVVISGVGSVGIGTTNPLHKLHVYGSSNFIGSMTASVFYGDASGLVNLPLTTSWTTVSSGIYNLGKVGIGTNKPDFAKLTIINESGSGVSTALDVHGESRFIGTMTVGAALTVKGQFLSTSFALVGVGHSSILAGVTTTRTLDVKESLKLNTLTLRENSILDVEGRTRLKSYTEAIATPSISSNVLTLDLSSAQTFNVTLTQSINSFVITNVPTTTSTTFLVKLTQDGTGGRTVSFTFQGANLYWAGNIAPTMTSTAGRTDLYSFTTLDGTNYYGVTAGQNFAG